MKAKFTEGEWFVNGYEIQSKTCSVELAKVTVFNEGKANAHLIAAAPDMYNMVNKVLEMQKQWYGYGVDTHMKLADMAKEMELLLARARGVDNT